MRTINITIYSFVLLTSLQYANTTQAQNTLQTFFNKTYKTDSINILAYGAIPLNDGALFTGIFGSTYYQHYSSYICKVDLWGYFKWIKIIDAKPITETEGYCNGAFFPICSTTEDDILVAYSKNDTTTQNDDIFVSKLDKNGKEIWNKKVVSTKLLERVYGINPTNDGGFIINGSASDKTLNPFDEKAIIYATIYKFDEESNLEWDISYAPYKKNYSYRFSEVPGKGYLVPTVSKVVSGTSIKRYSNLIFIDLEGKISWEKTYYNQKQTGILHINYSKKTNSYFLLGQVANFNDLQETIYLANINAEGELLWDSTYYAPTAGVYNDFLGIYEGPDICSSPLMTETGILIPIVVRYEYNVFKVVLYKLSYEGEVLFVKEIRGSEDINHHEYIFDIDTMANGGYLLTGFDYQGQAAWLVKVGENGETCQTLGCDSFSVSTAIPLPPQHGFLPL
ncbi:MAG: hypothetical protein IPI59_09975 [Sphingobacteriales bacterium]|jgi:hypothetical protein|nr:hypothetical protein [Sphingobacteriales bacterium]MBP9142262.1 hypothetical protein [Chitinophagales bacterium]MDA0199939.1 hypothetical protein [Bacteroidota bacterium]MBK6889629.1 hypothetical protein [Sphingobacteriales bacterium]MBK7527858.1 hypothetical protein [Sphingobacteriales bacterium]